MARPRKSATEKADTRVKATRKRAAKASGKKVETAPVEVKEVKEDTTLGNIVTIDHDKGITSVYQSISDITVKKDDEVAAGQIIAKSSTSNISTELENHLYFELIINGACVNPENYYGKLINEL